MISLNNLTHVRTNGADRIVIPKKVSEENIGSLKTDEVARTLDNRLFPFNRCMIEFEDDNGCTYFELTDGDEAVIIRDMNINNAHFAAVIPLNTVHLSESSKELWYKVPVIRAAAFVRDKRVRLAEDKDEEVKKTLSTELLSVLCVFTYINKVCLAEPELETKTVKKHKKQRRKNGNPVRYISTRKYILTGQERKSRRGVPKVYTREKWQVRGHWRTYKDGKRIWIKPHESRRDKDKLMGKCIDSRVYKIGI